jgi:hypothetical protein
MQASLQHLQDYLDGTTWLEISTVYDGRIIDQAQGSISVRVVSNVDYQHALIAIRTETVHHYSADFRKDQLVSIIILDDGILVNIDRGNSLLYRKIS